MNKVVEHSGRGLGTGAGRTKGTPNKSTTQAREAIALLVEGNIAKLQGWLDQIAANDPKAAMDSLIKLMEYHVPKLLRAEYVDETVQQMGVIIVDNIDVPENLTAEEAATAYQQLMKRI